MTRQQLRHQAAIARYKAEKQKPASRKQLSAWLDPIRKAFIELRSGEVDAHRGYPITRFHAADEDFARIDYSINGFVGMLTRLIPDFDLLPMIRLSKKLENGILLTVEEIDVCIAMIEPIEKRLMKFTRAQLIDAANTESILIELESLGLKEAA